MMKEQVITHDGELVEVDRQTDGMYFKYLPILVIKRIETFMDEDCNSEVFDSEYWSAYSLQKGIDIDSEEDDEFNAIDEIVKQAQTGVLKNEYSLDETRIDFRKIEEYVGSWEEFKVIRVQIKFKITKEDQHD